MFIINIIHIKKFLIVHQAFYKIFSLVLNNIGIENLKIIKYCSEIFALFHILRKGKLQGPTWWYVWPWNEWLGFPSLHTTWRTFTNKHKLFNGFTNIKLIYQFRKFPNDLSLIVCIIICIYLNIKRDIKIDFKFFIIFRKP